MQISKKMARKIQAKLQSMLPYEVNILNLSGQQLLSDSEKGELSIQESTSIENRGSKAGHSRELFAYGEKVGYLIIYSDASSNEFSLLLDLAKDLTESIVEAELKREEINAQENYQLALRNLLNYHDGIDVEAVRVILQKNSFECTVPRTMIYFDLFTKEQDQRIIALRDDTGNITAAGLVYDNFVEYLMSTFSRPHDVVLPCEDRHSVYVFCEDRALDPELSDIQIYNVCLDMEARTGESFWGDFRVVIGKRCESFSDYSGVYVQMRRRMESGMLLFPDQHVIFGRTAILGNVVAFIRSHAKASIIQLVLGMVLKDKAAATYISTLRELFQNNMNMSTTAEKLHIHRNTLQYRLKKIEELSGYSVYDIDGAVTLRLALLCYSYLEQFPEDKT